MKKILILIILSLVSFSAVSADEEDSKNISNLKVRHSELKAQVNSGEITKEEARTI
jgi:hypothetical protein